MKKAILYTQDGKQKGDVKLPEDLFSLPWSDDLVHQVVTSIATNKRNGLAHSKDRAQVKGGGRKPYRQKGTGRARHGSIRSPIWVGGGVTFGPTKERKYSASINKKMKSKAFFTVLSMKLDNDAIAFVDSISIEKPSTKIAKSFVEKVCDFVEDGKNKCTIVFSEGNESILKSFANLSGIKTVAIHCFNTKDALDAKKIFFVNPDKIIEQFEVRGSCIRAKTDEEKGEEINK